jgi:hypothetical protein
MCTSVIRIVHLEHAGRHAREWLLPAAVVARNKEVLQCVRCMRLCWLLIVCCACVVAVVQCTVPILVKCGGNYKQYFPSW